VSNTGLTGSDTPNVGDVPRHDTEGEAMPGGWEVEPITADDNNFLDHHEIQENWTENKASARTRVPPIYQEAKLEHPTIQGWVDGLVDAARNDVRSPCPAIVRGPSLLLLGPIGTGKTHAAYATLLALMASGARCRWEFTTESGYLAALRPRPRVDAEEEFERYAKAAVLVIDDMGAAKDTEWASEQNYRLINRRYEWDKPTLITSNIPLVGTPAQPGFAAVVGDRVASRLRAMCTTVSFKGEDRRARP
jgi:DNA replication protein DnaC